MSSYSIEHAPPSCWHAFAVQVLFTRSLLSPFGRLGRHNRGSILRTILGPGRMLIIQRFFYHFLVHWAKLLLYRLLLRESGWQELWLHARALHVRRRRLHSLSCWKITNQRVGCHTWIRCPPETFQRGIHESYHRHLLCSRMYRDILLNTQAHGCFWKHIKRCWHFLVRHLMFSNLSDFIHQSPRPVETKP